MSQFQRIVIDVGVVRALAAGDQDAAQRIYLALSGVVHTLALRVLHDRGLADEVTQDTFIDVIEKASALTDAAAFVPWVNTKEALVLWETRVMLLQSLLEAEQDDQTRYVTL